MFEIYPLLRRNQSGLALKFNVHPIISENSVYHCFLFGCEILSKVTMDPADYIQVETCIVTLLF